MADLTPAELALLDGDLEMVRRHPTATLAALEAASKPIKPFLYEAIERLINALPALVAAARERDQLLERQQVHLAQIAKLSQSTPLAEELAGWEGQRAKMMAEIGTLRGALAKFRDGRPLLIHLDRGGESLCGMEVHEGIVPLTKERSKVDCAGCWVHREDELIAEVGTLRAELDDVRRAVDAPGDSGTTSAIDKLKALRGGR